jgi:hypothetical protein
MGEDWTAPGNRRDDSRSANNMKQLKKLDILDKFHLITVRPATVRAVNKME